MTELVWNKAFKMLMENEGGYVNDPKDPGGETKYGVCKRAYPNEDILHLTEARAKEIYHKDYWLRCKCDKVPDAVSICLLDYAVNSGTSRAIKDLQRSLGVTADGVIGNQTIGACNRVPLKQIIDDYIKRRLTFLSSLKTWKIYGKGWGNRVAKVEKIAKELV